LATQAILRRVNKEILHAHINGCVKEAILKGNSDEKIEEIMGIIDKLSK
jgi:DNA-binding FrmR family transcriptional regulator